MVPHNSLDSEETLVLGADLASGEQLANLLPDLPSGFYDGAKALENQPPGAPPPAQSGGR